MNPYQRPSPRAASPASNLQTNPARTNNQRHSAERSPQFDAAPYGDRRTEEGDDEMASRGEQMAETDQRQYQKINQVIQNFYTKSALSIVSSRVTLPPSFNKNGDLRQNKWFNVILDESDELQQRLTKWKTMDAMAGSHPPLCIEIYLDISSLGHKQTLVIHDEEGKRWDVAAVLNQAEPASRTTSRTVRPTQVILERWKIYVGDQNSVYPSDLSEPLPNVYKKAVVLFRSLYSHLRLLPAFKYNKSIAKQPANNPSLKLNYRIVEDDFRSPHQDTLGLPLFPSKDKDPVTQSLHIGSTNSPIGPLCVSIEYRSSCEFTVDDSESLLSSQFMGLDDTYFEQTSRAAGQIPGSLPVNKLNAQATPDVGQAYGSLSTFHQVGPPTGTSPISALRAARDMPASSSTESPPQKLPPNHRKAQGSKSSLRSIDTPAYQRRTSVSFQPFKAGSLSSSPGHGLAVPPSPSGSFGRPSSSLGRNVVPSSLTQPRNRTSLNALPQAALRAPSLPNETAIASSASSSPKPAPIARYSSSFGHRRSKFSSGGTSKTEEDNLSSGKGSATSSVQRNSGTIDGDGASSGEVKTEDETIGDFLKLLESKKDLRSFTRSDNAARDASMRKTTAQLGKYQRMKDSHAVLSDSVTSSTMLHRSSSSSSRQLSSVPAMIHGTSISTASSPGKPISPHTPHTPAIPSRLSANSIIEYDQPHRSRSRGGRTMRDREQANVEEQSEGEDGALGMDIPPSSRAWNYNRRSSSVAQQHRNLPDDEPDLFGVRAASLPAEEVDRARDLHRITSTDLTSSGLFAQTEHLTSAGRGNRPTDAVDPLDSRDDLQRPSSTSNASAKRLTYQSNLRGRGGFFSHNSQNSSTSQITGSTGGTSSTERQSRYNFNSRATNNDDDEPLLFQMSEIGAGSRRSLEEGRGGLGTGSASKRSPWGR